MKQPLYSLVNVLSNLVEQRLWAEGNILIDELVTCPCCNLISECKYKFEGVYYCSENCVKEQMVLVNQVVTVCGITGLDAMEVKKTLSVNGWTLDEFTNKIDDYLDALSKGASIPAATVSAFKNAGIYNKLSTNLSILNTNQGGANFKGFVFEHLHATSATVSGTPTSVIGNNGVADFLILQKDGTTVLGQAKVGYQNTYIDFRKYHGQTIVVDKGNTLLIKRAKAAGLEVIESDVSLKQSKRLSDLMKLESNILRTANAPLTSKIYALNQAGIASAKVGGATGAGFSIGSNIVEVFSGDKDLEEAAKAVIRDTAIATASSYVIGAAAATPVGVAIAGTVTSTGTALAGTAVGSSVIAGAGAVTGVATAAASTTVGAAAIAGATAIGAAAVAAAPIVAGTAVVGGVFALGKKVFGRR